MAKTPSQIGKDVQKKVTEIESGFSAFRQNTLKRRDELKEQIRQKQMELAQIDFNWHEKIKELDLLYGITGKNKKANDMIREMVEQEAAAEQPPPPPPPSPPGDE